MLRVLSLVFLMFTTSAFAAPKSELWSYWDKSNDSNTQSVSHQAWQSFLDRYLVTEGENTLVRYVRVSPNDKQALKTYISDLARIDPRQLNRAEQYAYWVNLYNAITVDLILDEYPVKSITKLGGLFSFGPWGDEVITITGQALTLNDIEHRILRPIWNDSRTHYAVNCASLGCPNLQTQAFTANNTEALLESAANAFVNSSKGASISGNTITLSSIYEWFEADFVQDGGALKHMAKYRPDLANFDGKIKYDYDWDLNKK
ncbi:DUF547 domain-containing protein [Vibrio sp. SCSIO 43140]|uniref:DUF547 domain-containing protein n=1 Tax=Vibrio sp. SCSIO 43140 TaxID=2819100 RepID=UPI0020760131|nr:DUF547 domain-containing protein [Vibrio sp. SCSIO 43140]USD62230.1 DUF547 domain-containing protein [Vibrio sp. SCSIO 43140]